MVCHVCGRTIKNEEANFCDYCGASFREDKVGQSIRQEQQRPLNEQVSQNKINEQDVINMRSRTYSENPYYNPSGTRNQNSTDTKPMSTLSWLGIMVLPLIPYIGSVTFLVVLFVFAFKKDGEQTRKNWARATLIFLVICILFGMIFMQQFMNMFSMSPTAGSI